MNRTDRLPTVVTARTWLLSLAFAATAWTSAATAQPASTKPATPSAPEDKPAASGPTTLPDVIISEPKLGQDLRTLPLSATVAGSRFIDEAATRTVKDAAIYSPNTTFTEFTARKLSNPRIRGIGGSPMNPGVTTYFDGVPQFNGNSSSLELLDTQQVDIVRGPMGALFGRNTVGGLINVTSRRPSLTTWGGELESTYGNYNLFDMRGRVTGPLIQDQLGFSFAGGSNERQGYSENLTDGNHVDSRNSWFGKGQFLWTPSEELEVRFILAGESARDGDYALSDLAGLRVRPRQVAKDFIGYTDRDVIMPTLQVVYHGDNYDFTSTTGLVWWETTDYTDVDFGAFPATFRTNNEDMVQFTQEFRLSNPVGEPIQLSPEATLQWQAGLFFFHNDYSQGVLTAVTVGPGTRASSAQLEDWGLGLYGQGTLTLWDRLDLTAGVRLDYEDKSASLTSTLAGVGTFPNQLEDEFGAISPQLAATYRITPNLAAYASFAGGYKAGGFNSASGAFPGSVFRPTYDEERSWNYEIGFKGSALDERLHYNLAFYYTDWQGLQLNSPNPAAPSAFDIVNAGDAVSKGIELALDYEIAKGWDVFGSVGWQDAKFRAGSIDLDPFSGVPGVGAPVSIAGKQIPFSSDYNVTVGTQFVVPMQGPLEFYGRADIQFLGGFNYTSTNNPRGTQDAYTIANFRMGVRDPSSWFAELFVNNAFDTEYVPIAIPNVFGASGFVGENGAPITFGVRAGVKF